MSFFDDGEEDVFASLGALSATNTPQPFQDSSLSTLPDFDADSYYRSLLHTFQILHDRENADNVLAARNIMSNERLTWQEYSRGLPMKVLNDKSLNLYNKWQKLQLLVQNQCSEATIPYLTSYLYTLFYTVGPLSSLTQASSFFASFEQNFGKIKKETISEIYFLARELFIKREENLENSLLLNITPNNDVNSPVTVSKSIVQQQQQQIDAFRALNDVNNIYNLQYNMKLQESLAAIEFDILSSYQSSGNTENASKLLSHNLPLPSLNNDNIHANTPFNHYKSIPSSIPSHFFDIYANEYDDDNDGEKARQSGSEDIYTHQWLLSQCDKYTTFNNDGTPVIPTRTLLSNIVAILKSSKSTESIQNDLLDLLGFDAFEFISELVVNREILSKIDPKAQVTKDKNVKTASILHRFHKMSNIQSKLTTHDDSLIVSKKQPVNKKLQNNPNDKRDKLLQLLKKYRNRNGLSAQQIQHDQQALLTKQSLEKIPHIRKKTRDYEEIIVPPPQTEQLPDEDRVSIAEGFHPLVQCAFGHITRLNTLQSKVYPCAYGSGANMLVCAPTGAGKTNVALMSILQQVVAHIDGDYIHKDAFKIVYIAPMKALAAEVAGKFTNSLKPLGLQVREFTGDMQLTKKELDQTQVIVSTPEKWDVITRKSTDGSLMSLVKLLIIDEIHLLHEERGPVLETIVARTHRHIETSQQLCRIVGLSATLPNYHDVANFLAVSDQNLFYFDGRYRPVPLQQHYIGVYSTSPQLRMGAINDVCYTRTLNSLKQLNQVMVFVHARRDTVKTAQFLISNARNNKDLPWFAVDNVPGFHENLAKLAKITNSGELRELVRCGIGVHHAGLNRAERTWMEESFMKGYLSVLCSTATLSWGVNLPAHTVILKGTTLYDPKRGGFVDVGMLDVMQIFGRAGRPQFDTSGEAVLITDHTKLFHYTNLLTSSLPIESQMIQSLPDHLNAEIILGTVTNVREADIWLTYTYLYTRMLRNPTNYGVSLQELDNDPLLHHRRRVLITNATKQLMKCKMVKYELQSGNFYPTDIGRVAALYYLHHNSVEVYNELLKTYMSDEQVLDLIAHSKEFEQLKVRDEEIQELTKLIDDVCIYKPLGGFDTYVTKANILLQCYISGVMPTSSTLQSDQYFVQQSAGRIARALFEIVLRRGKAALSHKLLDFCKFIEHRMWPHQHPLRQFPSKLQWHTIRELEREKLNIDDILDMTPTDISHLITASPAIAANVSKCTRSIPWLHVETTVQPLTRDVIRINLHITSQFTWDPSVHGEALYWWIWVEDPENESIYHHEQYILTRAMAKTSQFLSFTIPISEPLPTQYILRVFNDRWIASDTAETISFHDLLLPDKYPSHTELLPLQPMAISSLHNPLAHQLFKRFTHFNPVQTQAFHSLFHTDVNILLGAPTGSGKTVIAEIAMLRALNTQPGKKIIYIAPMKALVKERYLDWSGPNSFGGLFGCNVLELTGDSNPDVQQLNNADIVITTPEKWDGLSRSWQSRDYVKNCCLLIIDEIHLLGADRGPILEVIVSRMRYITALQQQMKAKRAQNRAGNGDELGKKNKKDSENNDYNVRIVGLTTALSNAHDIADWLGIPPQGLFNFHPAVRPVPLTTYISGFSGKSFCPRNATMNKPCYAAITTHSPTKPVLIFVASRRQTRLTALDLISLCAADGKAKQWLKVGEEEMDNVLLDVQDETVKHCLSYGIGLHHSGLLASDREIVEKLFLSQKIQVLCASSSLAWGVNLPPHLVIVKDVQYYDTKTFQYADYSITDVLQMTGRAGRPQFDNEGKAVVLLQDTKKSFYQRFLHSPFPVESALHKFLHNHLNAEIAQGAIQTLNDAVEWLSWTFFFRRLMRNPTYYGLSGSDDVATVNAFLLRLLQRVLEDLANAGCIVVQAEIIGHVPTSNRPIDDADEEVANRNTLIKIQPTTLGQICAYYYLDYRTAKLFFESLHAKMTVEDIFYYISSSYEYWELPVRHNEDVMVMDMLPQLVYSLPPSTCSSPYTKANLLFQARLKNLPLPISDFQTDTLSALANAPRIVQSMIDLLCDSRFLVSMMNTIYFAQMMVQGTFIYDNACFYNIPHLTDQIVSKCLNGNKIHHLPQLMAITHFPTFQALFQKQSGNVQQGYYLSAFDMADLYTVVHSLPKIDISFTLSNTTLSYNNHLAISFPRSALNPSSPPVALSLIFQRTNSWKFFHNSPQKASNNTDSGDKFEKTSKFLTKQQYSQLSHSEAAKVIGPTDVKTTKEGWHIIIHTQHNEVQDAPNDDDDDIIPLPYNLILYYKRLAIGVRPAKVDATIDWPELIAEYLPHGISQASGKSIVVYLTLMSDCYVGLDQQYPISITFD